MTNEMKSPVSKTNIETELIMNFKKLTKENRKLCMAIMEKMISDPEYNQAILSWDGNPSSIPMP